MPRLILPIVGTAVGAFFVSPQLVWVCSRIIGEAIDPGALDEPEQEEKEDLTKDQK